MRDLSPAAAPFLETSEIKSAVRWLNQRRVEGDVVAVGGNLHLFEPRPVGEFVKLVTRTHGSVHVDRIDAVHFGLGNALILGLFSAGGEQGQDDKGAGQDVRQGEITACLHEGGSGSVAAMRQTLV